MIDIGWMEMLVVAMVALVVIGPKDLPRALRTAGQWVGKVRGIAREFQNSVDDMIHESELEEYQKEFKDLVRTDGADDWENGIDPSGGPAFPKVAAIDEGGQAEPGMEPPAPSADEEAEIAGERPASIDPASIDPASIEPASIAEDLPEGARTGT